MDTGRDWEPSWHRVLFLLGLKGKVLADLSGWGFKAIHCFYCEEHMTLWMWTYAIWAVQCPSHIPKTDATVWVSWTWPTVWSTWLMWLSFQRQKRNVYITCALCLNASGTTTWSSANQVQILQEWAQLLGSPCLQGRCVTQQGEPKGCGQICPTTDLYRDLSLFGLGGAFWQFIQGFMDIVQPLHEHLSEAGTSKKNKPCNTHRRCIGGLWGT